MIMETTPAFLTDRQIGGVFWTKFELSLSKTPTKEAPPTLTLRRAGTPATARQARHTTEKYSLLFSFCARRTCGELVESISFSPNEKSIFLWCPAFQVFRQVAGLASF